MKTILLLFILCSTVLCARSQDAEKTLRTYFSGWEKKDWNIVAGQLADDFTFTSAAGDDHLSIAKFKETCWGQAAHIKRVEFPKITVDGNTVFAIYNLTTNDDKVVRNVEYYVLSHGKIKSIECFFGDANAGYPTNAK
jgi:hypothetical protein